MVFLTRHCHYSSPGSPPTSAIFRPIQSESVRFGRSLSLSESDEPKGADYFSQCLVELVKISAQSLLEVDSRPHRPGIVETEEALADEGRNSLGRSFSA